MLGKFIPSRDIWSKAGIDADECQALGTEDMSLAAEAECGMLDCLWVR